jgi:hypothetical protein
MYVVFEVEKSNVKKAENVFTDDMVSRQSIVVRDSRALDLPEFKGKDVQFIIIEGGSQEALDRAKKLFEGIGKPMPEKEAVIVHNKVKEQDDTAACGVGALFGD